MQLKPQDFLVALKLVAWGEQRWTYARLAQELGISVSEAHACIKRGWQADLLVDTALLIPPPEVALGVQEATAVYRAQAKPRRAKAASASSSADNPARVHSRNLAEFAVHAAKYAFAADRLPVSAGVPTSHSAPAFAGCLSRGLTTGCGRTPMARCAGRG